MTNKQIIIDGVDIKDCKRRIGKDNFCRYYKRPCAENNYNCIWKKYLRKEQELQEAMDNYVQLDLQRVKEYNELVELYKAKEQECEELKKLYKELQDDMLSCNKCRATIKLQQQLDQLKQTLTKIEEIAEVLITMTDEYDSCYYKNRCSKCEVKEDCQYFKVEQILQKISECEV